jgi:iron complex outermembrane receptor protein
LRSKNAAALAALATLTALAATPALMRPVRAQDTAPPATLPEVKVTADKDRETAGGPVSGYTARRSATATKTDTPLSEVPQSITVIGADQIRDQASQNMQEVLRYTAGVRAELYGIDNRGDWFSMRGGSEGSTLLDGLRLPLSGWWGIVRNEPYAFERIEVLRGPASLVAGQNGPGGVVNLVSKRPQADAVREVALQLGNYEHRQVATDLTGPIDPEGRLLYRVVALVKDSNTQVDHAFDKRRLFAPSLTWKLTPATPLTLFAEHQKDESGNTNAFLPYQGTVLPAPNGPIPMETFIGEPDWDTYGGTRNRAGWHVRHDLTPQWHLRHNLRHDRVEGTMRTMYAAWWLGFADSTGAPDPNGRYLNRIWYANDDNSRITNADLLLEGELKHGTTRHTLLFGIDGMTQKSDQKSWSGAATPLDVYTPVYGTFALPALPDAPAVDNRIRRVGVLAQDQIRFDDRWVLVAGLRRDRATAESTGTPEQNDSATSRSLGAVLLAGPWSPYVSYSESFEPVAGTTAGGAAFEPMRGKQVETGVKWQAPDRRLAASGAAFKLIERNRLATDPNNVNFSIQRGEITVEGLELELSANLRSWDLLASYTYTDARVTSTTADDVRYLDQQIYGIPVNAAAVWAIHRFGTFGLPGLRAGLGVRHVDEVSDGIGQQYVPSVTQLDALVSYETGAWRAALNVNNLTDKKYVAACLERGDCWFGARRKAVATLAYRW